MRADHPARDSEAVRKTASDWIARRDGGLLPAEAQELAAWRDADPAHAAALDRYEKLWSSLDRPRAAGTAGQLGQNLALLDTRARGRRRGMVGAAAAFVLVAGIVTWTLRPTKIHVLPAPHPMAVILPERRVLADGTVVEFPAGARITVDYTSPEVRRVTLVRGEAHFQVAKNAQRPFVVRAAGVDVQAVGTAFSVQLAEAQVEVVVTEGRVAVERQTPMGLEARTLIDSGQKLSVNVLPTVGAPPPQAERLSSHEMDQRLAWRAARMEFSDTPLSEVIVAVNRYASERGGEQFKIDDPTLKSRRMSGIFRVDDADTLVGILEQGFGIEAVRVGGEPISLRARR